MTSSGVKESGMATVDHRSRTQNAKNRESHHSTPFPPKRANRRFDIEHTRGLFVEWDTIDQEITCESARPGDEKHNASRPRKPKNRPNKTDSLPIVLHSCPHT